MKERGRKGGRIRSYNSNDVICDLLKCTNFPIIFPIVLFYYFFTMLKNYKNSSELLRVNLDTSIHWSSHKIAMDNLFLLSLQGPHMKVDGGTSLHPVAYDSERSLLLYHCTMRVRWPSTYEQHERIYIITGVWFQRIHHITDVPKRWGIPRGILLAQQLQDAFFEICLHYSTRKHLPRQLIVVSYKE